MPRDSELIVKEGRRIYHLGLSSGQIAPNIVLCGDPGRVDLIASLFDPGTAEPPVANREFVTRSGSYHGLPVCVIGTGIGADNTEIALVELYALNEFDLEEKVRRTGATPLTVIRVGTCGTPRPDVQVGSLAISSFALGLENTGVWYDLPESALSDTALAIERQAERLLDEAVPQGYRFKGRLRPYVSEPSPRVVAALADRAVGDHALGITVTAPGFFAPQGREIDGLRLTAPRLQERLAELDVRGHRVVNLEMETSLLFHLTRIMGYASGSVCAVIANRATGAFLPDYGQAVKRAAQTALEALRTLNQL